MKHGNGKFTWKNGDVYEGRFINNSIEGIGKIIFNDRKTYDGEWKANKMNGKGLFTYPD